MVFSIANCYNLDFCLKIASFRMHCCSKSISFLILRINFFELASATVDFTFTNYLIPKRTW